jgi:hypothetical protein
MDYRGLLVFTMGTEPEATQQTAFRLPVSLLARLNLYAERMRSEQKGLSVTRSDVVRLLLTKALDDLGVSLGDT